MHVLLHALSLVPMATRLPAKSVIVWIGELANLTKNIGPALAGATMRSAILRVNGGVASLARPIQFEAMKPNSSSP
jgi:hypothetical protein